MGLGNDVVARRMAARGRVVGPLGDYLAPLPNQIIATRGDTAQGPLTSPTVAPASQCTDTVSCLQQILAMLQRMPVAFSQEFRTRFIIQPRESVAFVVPGETTSVSAGAAQAIASFKMNENFTGFLTAIGVNVTPISSIANVAWQLRVNGNVHPNFNNQIFAASTLATPLPFAFELIQNRTVQLVAINKSGGPLDISGVLVGWTEFMASYKSYGGSPQSGIA
jgi:hypothetical protein